MGSGGWIFRVRKLADEEALALQGYLNAMHTSKRSRRVRWSGALAMAACLVVMVSMGAGWQPSRWVDDFGADYVTAPGTGGSTSPAASL